MFQPACQVRSEGKWRGKGQPIRLYQCDGQRGLKGRAMEAGESNWAKEQRLEVCLCVFFFHPLCAYVLGMGVWSQDEPHDFFRISLQHLPQLPSYIMHYCMQVQLHQHI